MGASAEASGEDSARIALGAVAPPAAPTRRLLGRAIAIGAPLAYVAALATVIVSWGLPLAHDQLFFWVLLGLAAFSVPGWRSWGVMLLAWLPWLGLLVVYDELRAAVSVAPADAYVDRADRGRQGRRRGRRPDRLAPAAPVERRRGCTGTTTPSGPST